MHYSAFRTLYQIDNISMNYKSHREKVCTCDSRANWGMFLYVRGIDCCNLSRMRFSYFAPGNASSRSIADRKGGRYKSRRIVDFQSREKLRRRDRTPPRMERREQEKGDAEIPFVF